MREYYSEKVRLIHKEKFECHSSAQTTAAETAFSLKRHDKDRNIKSVSLKGGTRPLITDLDFRDHTAKDFYKEDEIARKSLTSGMRYEIYPGRQIASARSSSNQSSVKNSKIARAFKNLFRSGTSIPPKTHANLSNKNSFTAKNSYHLQTSVQNTQNKQSYQINGRNLVDAFDKRRRMNLRKSEMNATTAIKNDTAMCVSKHPTMKIDSKSFVLSARKFISSQNQLFAR